MRLPSYPICLVLFVLSSSLTAAAGQTADTGKSQVVPLPPARHGQPAFSFSGGKRVSSQQTTVDGLRDYSAGSGNGGTGIVEIGKDKGPPPLIENGTGRSSTGIVEIGAGRGTAGAGATQSPPLHDHALSGSPFAARKAAPAAASALKSRTKPATTVVQVPGADGKMEYKEVPFMGTLPANKRDASVIEVKDGAGKVKEYEWAKKNK